MNMQTGYLNNDAPSQMVNPSSLRKSRAVSAIGVPQDTYLVTNGSDNTSNGRMSIRKSPFYQK